MKLRNKLMLLTFIAGCTSTEYKIYGIRWPASNVIDDAALFIPGGSAKDDIPFDQCKPDQVVKGKCVVMLREEFFRLMRDFQDTKTKLADLEKVCSQKP